MRHPSIRSKSATLVSSWLPAYATAFSDAHVLIASQTVGAGGAASVTFSSIPGNYKALQMRGTLLQATAGYTRIQANSDTATNYAWHQLSGNGTAASSTAGTTQAFGLVGYTQVTTASYTGAFVLDVLDYSSSKYKTLRSLWGADANGSGIVGLESGLWLSTSAITSLVVYPAAGNFNQYSQFDLYGVL